MTEETEVIAVELDLDTTVAMLLRGMAEGDEISLHFPGVDGGIKVQRSSEVAQALVDQAKVKLKARTEEREIPIEFLRNVAKVRDFVRAYSQGYGSEIDKTWQEVLPILNGHELVISEKVEEWVCGFLAETDKEIEKIEGLISQGEEATRKLQEIEAKEK
jgi:hypothetical protein